METKTCAFSNGHSEQVSATVTYRDEDGGVMTGYKIDGGNAKYPYSNSDMNLSVMLVDGQLSTAGRHLTEAVRGIGRLETG